MYHSSPHASTFTFCSHCGIACGPAWQRVDHDEYRILCRPCQRQRDAEFTEERAIWLAIIIVGIHIGRLNAEGVQQ
jgi:hypothetical protein